MRNVFAYGALAIVGIAGLATTALAAGEAPGRYSMSPADSGGFVRLDTETGQMALCQRRDADWSCREMAEPNRGLALEVERLRTENQRLKGEIRQMEDIVLGDKRDTKPGGGKPEFKLPSEQDVDGAVDYVQRMLRKLRERMKDFDIDGKGTPL